MMFVANFIISSGAEAVIVITFFVSNRFVAANNCRWSICHQFIAEAGANIGQLSAHCSLVNFQKLICAHVKSSIFSASNFKKGKESFGLFLFCFYNICFKTQT